MPVTSYQGPIYFHPPASRAYRDNFDKIDFSKPMSTKENTTTTAPVTPKVSKHKGRPKGSKNKSTLEKERLAALAAQTPEVSVVPTPDAVKAETPETVS